MNRNADLHLAFAARSFGFLDAPVSCRHDERLEALTIQADVDLLAGTATLEVHFDGILSVQREVMANGKPAARTERQIVVHPVVLHQVPRDVVELDGRLHRDVANRQPADPARRRQVALEQPGRHRQHVGIVVEPVHRVVGRQERGDVGIERQEIADGVGVLGAVQAMNAGASRVGPDRGIPIEGRLEADGETVLDRFFGPGQAGRRHVAASELTNDLFPHRGSGPDRLDADAFEGETCRLQPVVMTAETVAFDERLVAGSQDEMSRGRRVATLGVRDAQRHRCGQRHDEDVPSQGAI